MSDGGGSPPPAQGGAQNSFLIYVVAIRIGTAFILGRKWSQGTKTYAVLALVGAIGAVAVSEWASTTPPNYYATLGVPAAAEVGEIKRAYRQASLVWHPDKIRLVRGRAAAAGGRRPAGARDCATRPPRLTLMRRHRAGGYGRGEAARDGHVQPAADGVGGARHGRDARRVRQVRGGACQLPRVRV